MRKIQTKIFFQQLNYVKKKEGPFFKSATQATEGESKLTIGYGRYGAAEGQTVNKEEAEQYFEEKGHSLFSSHMIDLSEEPIEENIGISKDYNLFELTNAVAAQDIHKAYKIIHYFEMNPKAVHLCCKKTLSI